MIVKIITKKNDGTSLVTGEHGVWLTLDKVPQKVLLETATGIEGFEEGTGQPAIKINSSVFYFGQPKENITKYRVLAIGTVVVCTQT